MDEKSCNDRGSIGDYTLKFAQNGVKTWEGRGNFRADAPGLEQNLTYLFIL